MNKSIATPPSSKKGEKRISSFKMFLPRLSFSKKNLGGVEIKKERR